MNKKKYIVFLIGLVLLSCNSQDQNKIRSKKNVQLAEKILEQHRKYTEEDTTANSALLEALAYVDQAIEFDSTNVPAYQNKITLLTILGNRKNDLIKPLVELVKLKPNFAEGFFQLGLIYESQKHHDSATFAFNQAKNRFLKRPASDTRNYNLVLLEFLITKNENAALEKLKEIDVKDVELKKKLLLDIDAWEKGNLDSLF